MQPHWPLTLYHDGDCPLCAREIAWLRGNADPARLQLSDIRSPRYTNQFSPIELDQITAANPGGALWLRFELNPGKHEQLLRIFAPDLKQLDLYVLDGETLIEQSHNGSDQPLSARPLPSTDLMVPLPQREGCFGLLALWCNLAVQKRPVSVQEIGAKLGGSCEKAFYQPDKPATLPPRCLLNPVFGLVALRPPTSGCGQIAGH